MAFGDKLNMGDVVGPRLECAHLDTSFGDKCPDCGKVNDHRQALPNDYAEVKNVFVAAGSENWTCPDGHTVPFFTGGWEVCIECGWKCRLIDMSDPHNIEHIK